MRRAAVLLTAVLVFGAAGPAFADHDYDDGCWEGECYDGGGGQSYDDQWSSDQNNHNRRNRGAFSPGPFDDSPVDAFNGNVICLPGSTCEYRDPKKDGQPPPQ